MSDYKQLVDEELRAIEERAAKATEGPWEAREYEDGWCAAKLNGGVVADLYTLNDDLDANFIAHARDDVPRLVAALREAQAEVEQLREELRHEEFMRELDLERQRMRADMDGDFNDD